MSAETIRIDKCDWPQTPPPKTDHNKEPGLRGEKVPAFYPTQTANVVAFMLVLVHFV